MRKANPRAVAEVHILPGRPHDVVYGRDEGLTFPFLEKHTRDAFPRRVSLRTRTLEHPRAFWAEVLEKGGGVAQVDGTIEGGQIVLRTKNVKRLRLLLRPRARRSLGPRARHPGRQGGLRRTRRGDAGAPPAQLATRRATRSSPTPPRSRSTCGSSRVSPVLPDLRPLSRTALARALAPPSRAALLTPCRATRAAGRVNCARVKDTTPHRRLLPWISLLVVWVVWGSTYLAMRIVVREMPPLVAAATRFLGAGTLMGLVALVVDRREPPADAAPGRSTTRSSACCSSRSATRS